MGTRRSRRGTPRGKRPPPTTIPDSKIGSKVSTLLEDLHVWRPSKSMTDRNPVGVAVGARIRPEMIISLKRFFTSETDL